MKSKSIGQSDPARDIHVIERSGFLASKASNETHITCPANAKFCTWGGHVFLTP